MAGTAQVFCQEAHRGPRKVENAMSGFDARPFAQRRKKVLKEIGDGIAVVFGAKECPRNSDNTYPFRQNSHFLWLTGYNEPEAILVLDGARKKSILFNLPKKPEEEVWTGIRHGQKGAVETFKMDEAYCVYDFDDMLAELLIDHETLWSFFGDNPEEEAGLLEEWWGRDVSFKKGVVDAKNVSNLRHVVDPMRLIKDKSEIALLKKAAKASALGHNRAMMNTRPGMIEWEIEGEILNEFAKWGCRFPSYNTIVASGVNACVLHYVSNSSPMKDGDLVMIDAGAECEGYAGDISRTYPVNGKFSPAQRKVYEAVLRVNEGIIKMVSPKVSLMELNRRSQKLITKELIDLGLVQGPLDEAVEDREFFRFYMHSIGHYLGLDVHDVGERFRDGKEVKLQPGMCITVEPGIYIPDEEDIPKEYRGIGIRIEDNVLVTEKGCEVYTNDTPKDPDEVEKMCMKGRRK